VGERRVAQVDRVEVEVYVILGRATLPMHQLLRMGRGAVIPLDAENDEGVYILANNHPIAIGDVVLDGERVTVEIRKTADVAEYFARGR
jgi:flagellar motor switch protein FliN